MKRGPPPCTAGRGSLPDGPLTRPGSLRLKLPRLATQSAWKGRLLGRVDASRRGRIDTLTSTLFNSTFHLFHSGACIRLRAEATERNTELTLFHLFQGVRTMYSEHEQSPSNFSKVGIHRTISQNVGDSEIPHFLGTFRKTHSPERIQLLQRMFVLRSIRRTVPWTTHHGSFRSWKFPQQ